VRLAEIAAHFFAPNVSSSTQVGAGRLAGRTESRVSGTARASCSYSRPVTRRHLACRLWGVVGITLLIGPVLAASADAASAASSPMVQLRVLPSEVTLSPGDAQPFVLLIDNPCPATVRVTKFQVIVPPHLSIVHAPRPSDIGAITAGGTRQVTVTLRGLPGLEAGPVSVLVSAAPTAQPQSPPVTVSTSINVKSVKQDDALTAVFLSSPSSLDDGRGDTAWVRVTNSSPYPVVGVALFGVPSHDLTLHPVAGMKASKCTARPVSAGPAIVGCIATLAPQDSQVVGVLIKADGRVRVGPQRVSVYLEGAAQTPGGALLRTAVVGTDVKVSVYGIDALGPFGVATLFVLPGLVAVLAFLLLARFVYPRLAGTPDTIDFKDPKTLLFVVPPAALIFTLVWVIKGVDLTDAVGTADVLLLFGLGAAIGALAWVVVGVVYYARSGRLQYSKGDDPAKVLKRLQARHGSLLLPTVTLQDRLYRFLGEGAGKAIVACSPITATYAEGLDAAARAAFRAAIQQDNIEYIRRAAEQSQVKLAWTLPSGVVTTDSKSTVGVPDRLVIAT
jgi:hypothetical protein